MISISEATVQDIPFLQRFQEHILQMEREYDPFHKPAPARIYEDHHFKRLIARKDAAVFVAQEKEPVGCALCILSASSEHWMTYRNKGTIAFVYVKPDYRRKKIGQELLKKCIDWLNQKGADMIRLKVYAQNKAAHELYTSLGFQDYLTEMILPKI
ncbi:GNAT family N-acetyltransferase [Candidatus Woesearchaeota archaeon]|nr:GNAT family N-acetyltransferase [Candidatus Woesearchaeota archaeon]